MSNDPLIKKLRNHKDPDVRELVSRLEKTEAQMHKIMSISDVYQAQLHDSTAQLERMARTDMLTGLANRRDMTDRLMAESARCHRSGNDYAVILYDIDDFKRINDTWGHKVGDHVLVKVAEAVRSVLRVSDVCARWGGEEFLVLCPDTDLSRAIVVAEKCRHAVEETEIVSGGNRITVTVSGGVCTSRTGNGCHDWEHLVLQADTAMYSAKVRKKNKVVAYESIAGG